MLKGPGGSGIDVDNKNTTKHIVETSFEVELRRLDCLISGDKLKGANSILCKIDVEGFELNVVKGCAHLIDKIHCFVIETPVWQLPEYTSFMAEQNFSPVDIWDGNLNGQIHNKVDLVFVRKGQN